MDGGLTFTTYPNFVALVIHCKVVFFICLFTDFQLHASADIEFEDNHKHLLTSCRKWLNFNKKKKTSKDLKTYRHQTAPTSSSSKEPWWQVTGHQPSLWFYSCFFSSFFTLCLLQLLTSVTCYPKLKAVGPTPFASLPLLCLFSSCLQAPKGKWLSTIRWSPQKACTLTVHTFRHTGFPN